MNNHIPTRQDVLDATEAYMKLREIELKHNPKTITSFGFPDLPDLPDLPDPKCTACKVGLVVALTATITAVIAGFPEDTELIEIIAESTDLTEALVTEIIKDALDGKEPVSTIISKLCKEMGAC